MPEILVDSEDSEDIVEDLHILQLLVLAIIGMHEAVGEWSLVPAQQILLKYMWIE